MRIALGCLVALTGTLAAQTATAQVYPWCAHYGTNGGATNCGFATLQQCQWAISGNGGFCGPNPFYTAPDPRPPRQRKHLG